MNIIRNYTPIPRYTVALFTAFRYNDYFNYGIFSIYDQKTTKEKTKANIFELKAVKRGMNVFIKYLFLNKNQSSIWKTHQPHGKIEFKNFILVKFAYITIDSQRYSIL